MLPLLSVCLMIKDEVEQAIMTLNSVANYVDGSIIVHINGPNKEETEKKIEEFLNTQQRKFQIKIVLNDWVDYSYNRNLIFKDAYKTSKFLLYLDCNEICYYMEDLIDFLKRERSIKKNRNAIYFVNYNFTGSLLTKDRLIKNTLNCYEWESPVHEQLILKDTKYKNSEGLKDTLFYIENNKYKDTDSTPRFKRDLQQLQEYLKAAPDYMIFVTKWHILTTQMNLGLHDEARKSINEILNMGITDASFLSHLHYMLFICAIREELPEEEVMKHFHEANRLVNGCSPDLFYHAACYYYNIKKYDEALKMILRCCELPDFYLIDSKVGYNYDMLFYGRWDFLERLIKEHFPEKQVEEVLKNNINV